MEMQERALIHSTSVLFKKSPEFIVYKELLEENGKYVYSKGYC